MKAYQVRLTNDATGGTMLVGSVSKAGTGGVIRKLSTVLGHGLTIEDIKVIPDRGER